MNPNLIQLLQQMFAGRTGPTGAPGMPGSMDARAQLGAADRAQSWAAPTNAPPGSATTGPAPGAPGASQPSLPDGGLLGLLQKMLANRASGGQPGPVGGSPAAPPPPLTGGLPYERTTPPPTDRLPVATSPDYEPHSASPEPSVGLMPYKPDDGLKWGSTYAGGKVGV